jgi:hypothetical protein
LKRTFETEPLDAVRATMLLEMVKREGVQLEEAGVSYAAGKALERLMWRLQQEPRNLELLERANVLTGIVRSLPLTVELWTAQNIFYRLLENVFPSAAVEQDAAARTWTDRFIALGEKLRVAVPAPAVAAPEEPVAA